MTIPPKCPVCGKDAMCHAEVEGKIIPICNACNGKLIDDIQKAKQGQPTLIDWDAISDKSP